MATKEKLLQYLDYKGIIKRDFYRKTGLSNGFLDSGKYIGSDNLKIIIFNYPEININWLVMDEGGMLSETKSEENDIKENDNINDNKFDTKPKVKKMLSNEATTYLLALQAKDETITQLKEQIKDLKQDKERAYQDRDNWKHRYNLAQAEIRELKNIPDYGHSQANMG